MVKAFHKNNLPDYKKLGAFHLLYARGIRAYAYPILFLLSAALFLGIGIGIGNATLYAVAGILLALAVALPFITLAMQNAKLDKKMQLNPDYLKTEQFYVFEGQESFHMTIRAGGRSEEVEIPFVQVPRIYETKQYFYMYVGKSQVLILNKNNITAGSADELAAIFRTLGKQFKEKKKLRAAAPDSAAQ